MNRIDRATTLLREFKQGQYLHGCGVLSEVGAVAADRGKTAVLVADRFAGSEGFLTTVRQSVSDSGVDIVAEVPGARPNAPLEDLDRISKAVSDADPEVVISFGGGSTIDSVKAAQVLRAVGGSIDEYFGVGRVTQKLAQAQKKLSPHVAIQTAASSAAHLTKYSNITNVHTGQKKLIVDGAIVPARPVFDYEVTFHCPPSLTLDGGLDGMAHCLEVLYGAVNQDGYERIEAVALTGIALIVEHLPRLLSDPGNAETREAIGLATDLGGYAIMLGGTNGAHLTSFSLVDILSHGRACGLMNPYYTVFFAPAIERPLQQVGRILGDNGYIKDDVARFTGRDLGIAVAQGMIQFSKAIGFPTVLAQIPGFTDEHIRRALTAAKDPQLKMKLENMPVALTADRVDEYMGAVLLAARTGDLNLIKNVQNPNALPQ